MTLTRAWIREMTSNGTRRSTVTAWRSVAMRTLSTRDPCARSARRGGRPEDELVSEGKASGGIGGGASAMTTFAVAAGLDGGVIDRATAGASEAETDPNPAGAIVMACDDSDASEAAAAWVVQHVARSGDTMHFVHVMSDNRSQTIGVGQSSGCSFFDSVEDGSALQSLEDHQQHIEAIGEKLMNSRFLKHAKAANLNAQVHLPVIKGPESAADVGRILCNLSEQYSAKLLVVMKLHRGLVSDCGSVGHFCFEHATTPLLMIPPLTTTLLDKIGSNIMIVAEGNSEMSGCCNWAMDNLYTEDAHLHMINVIDSEKDLETAESACSFPHNTWAQKNCSEERVQRREISKYLSSGAIDTHPKFVVMYSKAQQGLIEELTTPSFAMDYCTKTTWPVVLLPSDDKNVRVTAHMGEEWLSHWHDHSYDSEENIGKAVF